MSALRRRLLRPAPPPPSDVRQDRRRQRLQTQLSADQQSLQRWMSKLKRAFHTIEKLQSRISRLERVVANISHRG